MSCLKQLKYYFLLLSLVFNGLLMYGQGFNLNRLEDSIAKLNDSEKIVLVKSIKAANLNKSDLEFAIQKIQKSLSESKDQRLGFQLLYQQYHLRRTLQLSDKEVYTLLERMQQFATLHKLEIEQLVAEHCQLYTDYFLNKINVQEMYASVIQEHNRIEGYGNASFKYYDLDDIYYQHGKFMFNVQNTRKALEYLKIAEQYKDENFHSHILVLNLIQSIYQSERDYTNGIIYADKILNFVQTLKNSTDRRNTLARQWQGIASIDKAAMLLEKGGKQKAELIAKQGYEYVKVDSTHQENKDYFAEYEALLTLVSIQIKLDKVTEASIYLNRLDTIYNLVGRKEYLFFKNIKYFDAKRLFFEKMKNYEQSIHYTNLMQALEDSLQKRNDANKLKSIEQNILTENYDQKLKLAEQEKKLNNWTRNSVIGLLALITLIAIINQKRILSKQKLISLKLEQSERDLMSFIESLQNKSQLIDTLEEEIAKLKEQGQNVEYLEKLKQSTILTEDDWINFKAMFEKVHPNFIAEQRRVHPTITPAELRILVLDKLNLSTAEMANMLGVQKNTVNQTWVRLRKKTGVVEAG